MKFLFIFLLPILSFAQVGIATETPQKSLHVNGSMQIDDELLVGGDASTVGNSGTKGQVLTSQGSGNAPKWTDYATTIKSPSLAFNVNSTGITSTNPSSFTLIPGLTYSYTPTSSGSLLIKATVYVYDPTSRSGSLAYANYSTRIYINNTVVTSSVPTSVAGNNSPSPSNLPISSTMFVNYAVNAGTTYTVEIRGAVTYTQNSGKAVGGTYTGTYNNTSYSSYSNLNAFFIPN